ncbi:hypothetical protein KY339_03455 [Candidatus Woesearchaeota archaeon]|nr:hypothetical protein [Candidatus Woesearchaeota archaeon]
MLRTAKDREKKQVSYENPGTILTGEELKKLAENIGETVTVVRGSYEWESYDWNSPTTKKDEIVLEGILGYKENGNYVFTHLVGREQDNIRVLYVLTAWHDIVEEIKDKNDETIFVNSHFSFYYTTVNNKPAPGLYKKGRDFHAELVRIAGGPDRGFGNRFLGGDISDIVSKDLKGHDIVKLA